MVSQSDDNSVLKAPKSGITIRMYNPGFGDCFLLAFRGEDKKPRYMLIDCGVHHQYPNREARLELVVENISKATGKHIHIVAITHEHTDHLHGFKYGKEIFEQMQIDDLWLAWTENPNDPAAKELKKRYGMKIRALQSAISQLGAKPELANKLQNVLGYEYEYESPDGLFAVGEKEAQLNFLREKSAHKFLHHNDYRQPGESPLNIPEVPGVKIYVLAPPKDVEWIRSLERKSELYPEVTRVNAMSSFASAVLAAGGSDDPNDQNLYRQSLPFGAFLEKVNQSSPAYKKHKAFFEKHYGPIDVDERNAHWRRIDDAWVQTAETLSLSINSKTNNTSLVLAIELTETTPKKVLLFPGDAQVGNWLSWHDLSWIDNISGKAITTEDLLNRTVLYKTAHHGSHNATLREKGLEMMDNPDLVVMIPVDSDWADESMHWEHPAKNLLKRLNEKAHGRVIRTDEIPDEQTPLKKPKNINKKAWKEFEKQLEWDTSGEKLWIQFTVTE